jgi:hypothetical protein
VWYGNHSREKHSLKIPGFNGKPTISKVVAREMKDEIDAEVKKLSDGAARGSHEWIGSYRKALSNVVNNLDDEELEAMQVILEEWLNRGIPADVQAE